MNRDTGRRAALFGAAGAVVGAALLALDGLVALLADWHISALALLALPALVLVAAAVGALPGARQRTPEAVWVAAQVSLLAVVLLASSLLVALLAGRFPQAHERDMVVPALAGAGLAALGFGWAQPQLRRVTAALVRARPGRPESVVAAFAERSSRGAGEDDLLALADSLRRTMRVAAAEIWRVEGTRLRRVASSPDRGPDGFPISAISADVLAQADIAGPAWLKLWLPELAADRPAAHVRAVAAAHFGQLLGVVLAEKAEAFHGAEDRALVDLGHRLGAVLGNLELDSALRATLGDLRRANEQLQASRARLVQTADAERRRIERDLHDGAQQQLVALAIGVGLIRAQLEQDPAAADTLLGQLSDQLKVTIAEVRELAHGIYPPALTRGGLPDALHAVIGRSPTAIELHTEGVGRYPPATEAAVYFCCLEALQNSGKHAGDCTVTITLTGDGARLDFVVADDGPGYDPQRVEHGHGLENMADRVGALGGEVRWESTPGTGVTVRGWVPAAPREAEPGRRLPS